MMTYGERHVFYVFNMTQIRRTHFFILTCFVGMITFARPYQGYIERGRFNQIFIVKNDKKTELKFNDLTTQRLVQKLSPGDFISLDGDLTADMQSLPRPLPENMVPTVITWSINFVGLRDLLGFWVDASGVCYSFKGFTSFNVFLPETKGRCDTKNLGAVKSSAVLNFNYFINPDEFSWNMLISSQESQYVAELHKLDLNHRKLILFDEEGNKVSEVELTKVR